MHFHQETTLPKLEEWTDLATDGEDRVGAKKAILLYVKGQNNTLNLRHYNLTSLPDIFEDKAFENMKRLNLHGNRVRNNPESILDLIAQNKVILSGLKPQSLTFFNMVKVTLIPCNQEYKDANIHHTIWFDNNELETIKNEFKSGFNDYLSSKRKREDDLLTQKQHFKNFIMTDEFDGEERSLVPMAL